MSAEAKGPRLWFKRGNLGADGKRRPGTWTIKDDGGIRVSTGIRSARAGKPPEAAQTALAEYVLRKREAPREKHRSADAVEVADVIAIYMTDIAPKKAREVEVLQRCRALLSFWGEKKLSEVTGRSCREYATFRDKPVARRELEDLRAAINYHRKEGLCREVVEVTLPEPGPSRERWLTRSEAARLVWAAWRYREIQKGKPTDRRSRQHVARFILVALYTGTRAGAVCAASLGPVKGGGWIDLDRGIFYRRGAAESETKKRRPPVQLPNRLLAHLRRWHANGQAHAVEWRGKPIGTGVEKAFRNAVADADKRAAEANQKAKRGTPPIPPLGDDVTPHTLRHTAATWLVANGVSLEKAADFLGMTVETLWRVYRHHAPGFQQEAADAITSKPKGSIRSTNRSTV